MNPPAHPHAWWLALLRAPGLATPALLSALERTGGDAEAAWQVLRPTDPPDWTGVQRDLEWLQGDNHHLLCFTDADYPRALVQTANPPPMLFVAGNPAVLNQPALAIVGSRNPTPVGRENAEAFAEHLAGCGLAIVSGLAVGIDTAAHRGALRAGTTIAVLGHGPDEIYPRDNRALAKEIAAKGAVITEFPVGVPPLPEHFPRRNRIISGLSAGTLVVEAALRSGSLITARTATEQGREVFAIPGSIHNPMAKGCHYLIRQGVKLVESAEHVLEELAPLLHMALDTSSTAPPQGAEAVEEALDAEYEQLLGCLEDTPVPVDRLVARSGLTPEIVSSMLLIMELRGLVRAAPGGYARSPKGRGE
jgi:DNA processing protein